MADTFAGVDVLVVLRPQIGQEDLFPLSTAEFRSATGRKSQAATTRFNRQFHI